MYKCTLKNIFECRFQKIKNRSLDELETKINQFGTQNWNFTVKLTVLVSNSSDVLKNIVNVCSSPIGPLQNKYSVEIDNWN